MDAHTEITGEHLNLDDLFKLLSGNTPVRLSKSCQERIAHSREYLERATKESGEAWYGVNTGFGSLYNVRISDDATDRLQLNLIRSHAAGTGPVVPYEIGRIVTLLKILSFSTGYSGVRVELVQKLVEFYNAGIVPAMYQFGSLGASGDLAPLAHLGEASDK